MSRLAKKSIITPSGVTVLVKAGEVHVKGPKGEIIKPLLSHTALTVEGSEVRVTSTGSDKQAKANLGTMWSLTKNAVDGVTQGFIKVLEIQGVGFKAALEGKTLVLSLGFVNPVRYNPPAGVTVELEKNLIKLSSIDKEIVGSAASRIRKFKKPEPYKGKGIRYQGEVVRMKAGKKAATSS